MLRLLDESDIAFLANNSSCSSKTVKKLRQERRRIFRSYLSNLTRDFNRLHMAAKLRTLYSEHDRPELAAALLRQKLTFSFAILSIKVRLALHVFGVSPVRVSGLLESLDTMRIQLSDLTADSPALG